MPAGTRCRAWKSKVGGALHFGWGESDAEADSGQAGGDHRPAFAEGEVALCVRLRGGGGRRGDHRAHAAPRASCHCGHRAYGQEKDVCQFRQGGARPGLEDCAGRGSVAAGGGVVQEQRICLEGAFWPGGGAGCVRWLSIGASARRKSTGGGSVFLKKIRLSWFVGELEQKLRDCRRKR